MVREEEMEWKPKDIFYKKKDFLEKTADRKVMEVKTRKGREGAATALRQVKRHSM